MGLTDTWQESMWTNGGWRRGRRWSRVVVILTVAATVARCSDSLTAPAASAVVTFAVADE
ncbi:hypothetical protein LuPra_01700 [Luteitalea pratensis]|uniref:Uncharacterized protein n=1 Tax=Luteitalea pratensis TaxID=1855912 RepID=A0A143PJS5_LUTPR|nr:hypothetical protein [Luteitalea pratensis]AMY08500.1 hypothetical protein LuPra_01700 [Luteitalea pratensis]